MATEQKLREKLRKISALFEGAKTFGERQAAEAAIEREEVYRDIREAPERTS